MRKCLLLMMFALSGYIAQAQTFTFETSCGLGTAIPDDECATDAEEDIVVSGVTPTSLNGTSIELKEARVIIDHNWVSNIEMRLRAPDGTEVDLSIGNGGTADDYGRPTSTTCGLDDVTIFTMASTQDVDANSPPWLGSYRPEGDFDDFHNGQDPNGTWQLVVCDNDDASWTGSGTIEYAALVFGDPCAGEDPQSASVTTISSTGFSFQWTSVNLDADYEVSYGLPGFTPGSGIGLETGDATRGANSVSSTTALSPNTTYEVYVREECAVFSNWVGPFTFTTTEDQFTYKTNCGMGVSIPDAGCFNGNSLEFTLATSNLPTRLGSDVGIQEIGIVIDHTWDDDLDIYLRSPLGTEIELSTDNGSFRDDYGNPNGNCDDSEITIFSNAGQTGITEDANAPFIGNWLPEGNLSDFNGQNPNGDWILRVCDDATGDLGTLEYVVFRFTDCIGPISLNTGFTSGTKTTFLWEADQANDYVIEFGTPGFTPGTNSYVDSLMGSSVVGANSRESRPNLTPSTEYEFYIKHVCGAGKESAWVGPFLFASAFQVTDTDEFVEDFGSPFCTQPDGWVNDNSGGELWRFGDIFDAFYGAYSLGDHTTGSGCYAWIDDSFNASGQPRASLISPFFDFSQLEDCAVPVLEFWWVNASQFSSSTLFMTMEVDITTDGGQTWERLTTVGGTRQQTWTDTQIDLSDYAGNESVRLRFVGVETTDFRSDFSLDDIRVFRSPDLAVSAVTNSQVDEDIPAGIENAEILRFNINLAGGLSCPKDLLQEITFNTNGTTDTDDILNAKVYLTDEVTTFYPDPNKQFGEVVVGPDGQFTVTGELRLNAGDNYFWLAYDVADDATVGNDLDAELVEIQVSDEVYVPQISSPTGAREIVGPRDVIYVTTTGAGNRDGSSWDNAYDNLSTALNVAQPYQQIWVARGTYFPGTSRGQAFVMRDNVNLYGGFAGNETSLNQRAIEFNTTTLSGDIGVFNNISDNSLHVVDFPAGVVAEINGFTITRGNANGGFPDNAGGGVITRTTTARGVFVDCTFRENLGGFGGAVISLSNGDIFQSCKFIENEAGTSGGAVYTIDKAYFYNSFFLGNDGGASAGAISAQGNGQINPIEVINCVFSGNSAGGGGIFRTLNGGIISVLNSSASNNSGTNGGDLVLAFAGEFEMDNSISWNTGNANNEIDNQGGNVNISNSIIDESDLAGVDGNINQNPLFIRPRGRDGIVGNDDDYLAIRSGSLAKDAADTLTATFTTIDGYDRDSLPDLGAYEAFDCAMPYDLRLQSLTSTEATVIWETGGSDRWDIVIVDAGVGIIEDSVKKIKLNPYTFSGLTPITSYEVYVRDNCERNNDGTSFWIGPLTFTTPPLNDECTGALPLLLNTICDADTGSNFASTNSTPVAGVSGSCANFNGGDVWYKATVPASGVVTFRTGNADGIQNTGIEIYSGDCDNLVSEACNDDSGLDGGFSQATATGLTPGEEAFVRVWENGGDAFGTFTICALRTPVIFVNDVQVNEDAGNAEFILSIAGADGVSTISVDYATQGLTATAGSDFTNTSGTLTFLPTEVSKRITVPILDDNLDENNEEFTLELTNPVNAILNSTNATALIVDEDPLPVLSITDATVTEGDAGSTTTATVFISLSTASGRDITFDYLTTSNSAQFNDNDFDRVTLTSITIPAGVSINRAIPIDIFGDNEDEADESFFVTVLNARNVDVVSNQGEITIIDDDFSPVAEDDGIYEVNEEETLVVDELNGVIQNDDDADNDPITAQLARGTQFGSISLNPNGSFTYTPDDNFEGMDFFTYKVSDGTNESQEATVEIRVNNINDIPRILELPSLEVCVQGNTSTSFIASSFTTDPDDDVAAANFNYTFDVLGVTPGTIDVSALNVNYDNVSKVATFSTTAPEPGTFSVRMIASDPQGAADTSFMLVSAGANLDVSFTFAGECASSDVVFRNTSTSDVGSLQRIEWDFDQDNIYEQRGFEVVEQFDNAGSVNVTLKVTNEFGCFAEVTESVNILPAFVPTISQDREILTSTEGVSYQWFFNGEPIPGATARELFIERLGVYNVRVTNEQGCTTTSADFEVTTTAITFEDISNTLELYPNPTDRVAFLSMTNEIIGQFEIKVMTISGQEVMNSALSKTAKSVEHELDVESLPSGVYLIQLTHGNYRAMTRFEKI